MHSGTTVTLVEEAREQCYWTGAWQVLLSNYLPVILLYIFALYLDFERMILSCFSNNFFFFTINPLLGLLFSLLVRG